MISRFYEAKYQSIRSFIGALGSGGGAMVPFNSTFFRFRGAPFDLDGFVDPGNRQRIAFHRATDNDLGVARREADAFDGVPDLLQRYAIPVCQIQGNRAIVHTDVDVFDAAQALKCLTQRF